MTRAALLFVLAAAVLGCDWTATFACETRDDCIDGRAGGVCEADGHCSFPDTECESGRRYGEHAPPGFAGTCVPSFDDDEPGVVVGIAESSSSSSPESTTDPLPAGEEDTSGAGSDGDASELPATTEEESGGAEDTGTGTDTSTGGVDGEPQDCNALDCASCLDCVGSPNGPCDDEITACTDANGCTSGVACMQECTLYGTCFDDCCLGDVGPLVDDVVLCAADHCIEACGEYEFLTCA